MIQKKKTKQVKKILEKDIQKEIFKYLKSIDIFCWRNNSGSIPVGGGYSRFGGYSAPRRMTVGLAGMPDILGVLGQNTTCAGRMLAIEVKRAGNTTTDLQELRLFELNEHGALAFTAYSVDEVKNELKKYLK